MKTLTRINLTIDKTAMRTGGHGRAALSAGKAKTSMKKTTEQKRDQEQEQEQEQGEEEEVGGSKMSMFPPKSTRRRPLLPPPPPAPRGNPPPPQKLPQLPHLNQKQHERKKPLKRMTGNLRKVELDEGKGA